MTFGIINQLIETVKQFNETIQKQADIINSYEERFRKLEGTLTITVTGRLKKQLENFGPDDETWGVLILLKFWQLKETGSSGATESEVWIGDSNVKAWKTTEHKLHQSGAH